MVSNGSLDGLGPHSPATLPCGRTLNNRMVKAAMYEHLADLGGGPPNPLHLSLYRKWGMGGWGMVITGNVQISKQHLTLGRDLCLHPLERTNQEHFGRLADAIHASSSDNRPLAIMQLSHSGRQSPRFIGGRSLLSKPVAPSSQRVGLNSKEGLLARTIYGFMFQKPHGLFPEEISCIIEDFVHAAKTAYDCGFDGIQLHASHGYLLSQFLSRKVNDREDEYRDGIRIVSKIVSGIRASLPASFAVGVKINAGDYILGGLGEKEANAHIETLAADGVDFIEVSGGDYENPEFMASTSARQVFFSAFSKIAMRAVASLPDKRPLIMLTGGIRTPEQMNRALNDADADLLGLGRPSVLCPDLPIRLRDGDRAPVILEPQLKSPSWFPKLIGAGVGTAWYTVQMKRIATGENIDLTLSGLEAVWSMWIPFSGLYQCISLLLVLSLAIAYLSL
ncbi:FMN-linked oxidoreductase [Sistotremastrum niveocremeum HHB9708]|uniref:FMN-linked oxidoreductase n=1 Tax=Sistotremastrum niveocremeum HHB9708 TaxID=1314777 RepID=A0A164N1E4_9AGAM|nr:FMN-linked oxidoreductase [Sistotremastrum niveocremeum HHB9708]